MEMIDLLYFLLGGVFVGILLCAYYLRKIFRILRNAAGGEPTAQEEFDRSFQNIKMK